MYKQLFFDDQRLYLNENLKRQYGKPYLLENSVYRDENVAVANGFPQVWRTDDGRYNMIYQGMYQESDGTIKKYILAAESDDGIVFRPRNSAREAGVKDPKFENQLMDYILGEFACLVVDEKAPREERLKLLNSEEDYTNWKMTDTIYVSGDGYHWKKLEGRYWNSFGAEPGAGAFYNKVRESYCIAARPDWGVRRISMIETRDWKSFTDAELCIQCDSLDRTLCETYGMQPFEYEGWYISFLWMYDVNPTRRETKYFDGTMTSELVYSLNGWHWQRSLREHFISGFDDDSVKKLGYENRMVFPMQVLREKDGSLLIYASACKDEHGQGFTNISSCSIQAYRLREDGFIKLATKDRYREGVLCTRENLWNSGEISVNLTCKRATLAIYDGDGNKLIDGYSHEDCNAFSGDSTKWVPTWKSGRKLDELKGRVILLELKMLDGEVYSFSGDYTPMMNLEALRYRKFGINTTKKGF